MMVSPLKISVITVVSNCRDTIEYALRSVASHSYGDAAHIVVDGGSTDVTIDVLVSGYPAACGGVIK